MRERKQLRKNVVNAIFTLAVMEGVRQKRMICMEVLMKLVSFV